MPRQFTRVGFQTGGWVKDPQANIVMGGPQALDQVPPGIVELLQDETIEMVILKQKTSQGYGIRVYNAIEEP